MQLDNMQPADNLLAKSTCAKALWTQKAKYYWYLKNKPALAHRLLKQTTIEESSEIFKELHPCSERNEYIEIVNLRHY